MKKITTLALVAMVALSASAAKKKAPAKDANWTTIARTTPAPCLLTVSSISASWKSTRL